MKNNINEHDMTKKMMDIIRGGFKKMLNEDETHNDTIEVKPSDAVYKDELSKLQALDTALKIDSFNIYPKEQDVLMIVSYRTIDTTILFRFQLMASEAKTSTEEINMTDEVNKILEMVPKYFINWKEDWDKQIQDYV